MELINAKVGERLKGLIRHLGVSVSEFCRKTGLARPLVDKLRTGVHGPRVETLDRISKAYPELNLNWLVRGKGEMLGGVTDDEEGNLLAVYREHIKENYRQTLAFKSSIRWFLQESREWDELDLNAKAVSLSEEECEGFQASLLLAQYQRRLTSELQLRSKKEGTTLLTEGIQSNRLRKRINQLEETIQKTINQPLEL